MKAQALADHLAVNLVDGDYEPLDTYFPDEEINSIEEVGPNGNQAWQLYFDGATNTKGTEIGAILISPTGQHYPATAQLHFFCTNNTTEYEACINGLNMAIDLSVQELIVLGDSDLLIRQAQGEWKTRDLLSSFHTNNVWKILAKGLCTSNLDTSPGFIMIWLMPWRLWPQCLPMLETLTSPH